MKKQKAVRFSISIPANLRGPLDAMVSARGYANRSQAITDLVRSGLVEHHQQTANQEVAGTITIVYDHDKPLLQATLTDIQHDHHHVILAALHIHLDRHHCMEILALRGRAGLVRKIAEQLVTAKGVKHGKLTITTTGKDLKAG